MNDAIDQAERRWFEAERYEQAEQMEPKPLIDSSMIAATITRIDAYLVDAELTTNQAILTLAFGLAGHIAMASANRDDAAETLRRVGLIMQAACTNAIDAGMGLKKATPEADGVAQKEE